MATVDDVLALGSELERSYPVRVRGRLKFRVGQLVYVAFSLDETVMEFAFPREERAALVGGAPEKFRLPSASDMRFNWVLHRLMVGLGDECLRPRIADGPKRRDRLGHGEGEIKACHGRAGRLAGLFRGYRRDLRGSLGLIKILRQSVDPALDPFARRSKLSVGTPEPLPGVRVLPVPHQAAQLLFGHLVALGERLQPGQAGTEPDARRSPRIGVVPRERGCGVSIAVARYD